MNTIQNADARNGRAALPADNEAFLTRTEVAELLKLHPVTLDRLAARGDGPPFVRLGERSRRYQVGLLRTWLAQKNREEFEQEEQRRNGRGDWRSTKEEETI